jgi:hypothetical protein
MAVLTEHPTLEPLLRRLRPKDVAELRGLLGKLLGKAKRNRKMAKRPTRIRNTGKTAPKVDPQVVADALGAERMSADDARRYLNGERPWHDALRQRLAYLEDLEATVKGWLEHAKKHHDLSTVRCLEDWLNDDGPEPLV